MPIITKNNKELLKIRSAEVGLDSDIGEDHVEANLKESVVELDPFTNPTMVIHKKLQNNKKTRLNLSMQLKETQ